MNAEATVVVENLEKRFPVQRSMLSRKTSSIVAVDEVSFAVPRGQIFGLVGESGCGKTTCAKLLVRLLEPTRGAIRIAGEDIGALRQRQLRSFRKNVQMIFQDPYESLNPRQTIRSTVAEPLVIQRIGDASERNDRIVQMFRTVCLPDDEKFLDSYPHELSGGQRQRVSIARALVVGPIFLVADEPVSMLDVSVKAGILNLLAELRSQFQLTMVFITHDVASARYLCDTLGVMYLGSLVEVGPTEELISRPLHPYTRALIAAVPDIAVTAKRERVKLPGQVPTPIDLPDECHFRHRCAHQREICARRKPELRSLTPGHSVACYLYPQCQP
jgi:peptide/nickel transport system ATP-binding protein